MKIRCFFDKNIDFFSSQGVYNRNYRYPINFIHFN